MTMQQLIDLGAPRLPPDHFYRVRSNVFGQGYVQIRRKRRGWRSVLLAERLVPQEFSDGSAMTPEQGIRHAAHAALQDVEDDLRKADYWAGFRRLEGDHHHDWRTR